MKNYCFNICDIISIIKKILLSYLEPQSDLTLILIQLIQFLTELKLEVF